MVPMSHTLGTRPSGASMGACAAAASHAARKLMRGCGLGSYSLAE